jgi:integrase
MRRKVEGEAERARVGRWAVAMRARRKGGAGRGTKQARPTFTPVTYPSARENPALVYLDGLPSPNSRRVMGGTLAQIAELLSYDSIDAEHFPWAKLGPDHSSALRARLIRSGRSPATVNRFIQGLRGVLKAAWRLGQMEADAYHRAADLKPVSGQRLPRGRAVEHKEVEALFRVCAADDGPAGARDAALLAVFLGAGLRRAEVTALDLKDYDPKTGELRVRAGKGRRERVTYATNGAADALAAWLDVRGRESGPLFVPVTKGGGFLVRRMTEQAVYLLLRKRREEAGVKEFSPHDLRRSFISALLDQGVDLVTVQGLAGHASIATTALYDRRGERAKKRAAETLRVPFAGR